jgi:hypothetical protein
MGNRQQHVRLRNRPEDLPARAGQADICDQRIADGETGGMPAWSF